MRFRGVQTANYVPDTPAFQSLQRLHFKMNKDNRILVGKIVAFQGVRGDVRVQTYTEKPTDYKNLAVFSDVFGADDFKFIRALPNTNVIIAHIRGFEDRTSAEVLRGTELFIGRDSLPAVDAGEYYQADLIGFSIVRNGENLGKIVCFQNFGAGDIMETDDGNMYSFKGASVDFDKKIVIIV